MSSPSLPMSYLRTFGAAGDPATQLGWGVGIISLLVLLIVSVLLVAGLLRRRARPASERELTVASDAGGMWWIYIGTGISLVVIVACAVWTVLTISALAMPARAAELSLRITGWQWWWEVHYLDSDPARIVHTANEIHIPIGRPVRLELVSNDVIHSFWVPRLAGKTDLIPGQTNVMWLQADQPGVYRGQCAEYCGVQHAHMAMSVIADAPEDYARWLQAQRENAQPPPSDALHQAQQTFIGHCSACHTVRGTDARGVLGPDLTHLMSRQTIAAGLRPNTRDNLAQWIGDPQLLKPGTLMPKMPLSGAELSAIVSYLQTLN